MVRRNPAHVSTPHPCSVTTVSLQCHYSITTVSLQYHYSITTVSVRYHYGATSYLLEVGTALLNVANPPRGATAIAVVDARSMGL